MVSAHDSAVEFADMANARPGIGRIGNRVLMVRVLVMPDDTVAP